MTNRRYNEKRAVQLREAQANLDQARAVAAEASAEFEVVSRAYDMGNLSVDDYWDAHDFREASAQDQRVAEAWFLRCQATMDDALEMAR